MFTSIDDALTVIEWIKIHIEGFQQGSVTHKRSTSDFLKNFFGGVNEKFF